MTEYNILSNKLTLSEPIVKTSIKKIKDGLYKVIKKTAITFISEQIVEIDESVIKGGR